MFKVDSSCQFVRDVIDEGNIIPLNAPSPSPWSTARGHDGRTSLFHRSHHKLSYRPVPGSEQQLASWPDVQSSSGTPSDLYMSEQKEDGDFEPTPMISSKQFTHPALVRKPGTLGQGYGRVGHVVGTATSSTQNRSGYLWVSEGIIEENSGPSCGDAGGHDVALQASSWAYCQEGLL